MLRNSGAERKRRKLRLGELVKLDQLGVRNPQDTFVDQVSNQGTSGERGRKPEEAGQTIVLFLLHIEIELEVGFAICGHGDAESGKKDLRTKSPFLFIRHVRLDLLEGFEVLDARVCMEQVILGLPKDLCQLLIVQAHPLGGGGFLAQGDEAMNIFNGAETFLPQTHFRSNIELCKSNFKKKLDSFRVTQRHALLLIVVGSGLAESLEVVPEDLGQSTELICSAESVAKSKRLLSSESIQFLKFGEISQDLEDNPIRLPQKPHPGGHSHLLFLSPSTLAQRVLLIKISDVDNFIRRFGMDIGQSLLGLAQEVANNDFQTRCMLSLRGAPF